MEREYLMGMHNPDKDSVHFGRVRLNNESSGRIFTDFFVFLIGIGIS